MRFLVQQIKTFTRVNYLSNRCAVYINIGDHEKDSGTERQNDSGLLQGDSRSYIL